MSDATLQLVEVLIALSPYVAFIALIVWSAVAEVRQETRAERTRRAKHDT